MTQTLEYDIPKKTDRFEQLARVASLCLAWCAPLMSFLVLFYVFPRGIIALEPIDLQHVSRAIAVAVPVLGIALGLAAWSRSEPPHWMTVAGTLGCAIDLIFITYVAIGFGWGGVN